MTTFRDAASTADAAASRDVPLSPEVGGEPSAELPSEPAPESPGEPGPESRADACIPLTCRAPSCTPAYCGIIGDGCGGSLNCGNCETGSSCKSGLCRLDVCLPISCDAPGAFPY
ncbi:MAG TPA: hypothetical protein VF524_07310, partial [Polyangia bacterium]